MYDEKIINNIKNSLEKDLGFKEIVFKKEAAEDLYYTAYDGKGTEDLIRVKPQLGTVFTCIQGKWSPVKGYKLE